MTKEFLETFESSPLSYNSSGVLINLDSIYKGAIPYLLFNSSTGAVH